jgi:hypothetical protein
MCLKSGQNERLSLNIRKLGVNHKMNEIRLLGLKLSSKLDFKIRIITWIKLQEDL